MDKTTIENKRNFLKAAKGLAKQFGITDLFIAADGVSLISAKGNGVERELAEELDKTMDSWIQEQEER